MSELKEALVKLTKQETPYGVVGRCIAKNKKNRLAIVEPIDHSNYGTNSPNYIPVEGYDFVNVQGWQPSFYYDIEYFNEPQDGTLVYMILTDESSGLILQSLATTNVNVASDPNETGQNAYSFIVGRAGLLATDDANSKSNAASMQLVFGKYFELLASSNVGFWKYNGKNFLVGDYGSGRGIDYLHFHQTNGHYFELRGSGPVMYSNTNGKIKIAKGGVPVLSEATSTVIIPDINVGRLNIVTNNIDIIINNIANLFRDRKITTPSFEDFIIIKSRKTQGGMIGVFGSVNGDLRDQNQLLINNLINLKSCSNLKFKESKLLHTEYKKFIRGGSAILERFTGKNFKDDPLELSIILADFYTYLKIGTNFNYMYLNIFNDILTTFYESESDINYDSFKYLETIAAKCTLNYTEQSVIDSQVAGNNSDTEISLGDVFKQLNNYTDKLITIVDNITKISIPIPGAPYVMAAANPQLTIDLKELGSNLKKYQSETISSFLE